MITIILDPSGNSRVEDGFVLVNDDVGLIQGICSGENLFIRGQHLCEWASNIAYARGVEVIWKKSPIVELQELFPTLSSAEIEGLFERLSPEYGQTSSLFSIAAICAQLWPDIKFWKHNPSDTHAFAWLVWLSFVTLSKVELAVITKYQQVCQSGASEPVVNAYGVTKSAAWDTLKEWLRVKKSVIKWPPVPIEVPSAVISRLADEWRTALVSTNGDFFDALLSLDPSPPLLTAAAQVTRTVMLSNTGLLSLERVEQLKPYLSPREYDSIFQALPPVDPGLPPKDLEGVLSWFKHSYLPFRRIEAAATAERVKEIARDFAPWFLSFYADSRAGGPGAESLSWCKTAKMTSSFEGTTLLVVLDGLNFRDGEFLTKLIIEKSPRLALDDMDIAIAPLPTVTFLAKPALFTGFTPDCAVEETEVGTVEKRAPNVVAALNEAGPKEVVIWTLLEPDHSYHQKGDSSTIKSTVDGWFEGFAARLVDLTNEISPSKQLRVIITTDHGRLLSSSQRVQNVPTGMTAHGRAAWGPSQINFGENGYMIDGNLAYIHPQRFGVPQVCALVLNDEAFVTSDGRGGRENYPHGGLFPEEVFIPWIEISRDRSAVSVSVSLTGTGVSGSSGRYVLEVVNTSMVHIELVELALPRINLTLPLRLNVGAMAKKVAEIQVPSWPSKSEANDLHAVITFLLPTGERKVISIITSLSVEEMYTRADILDDL